MGENFPSGGHQEIISRELEQLRTAVRNQDNAKVSKGAGSQCLTPTIWIPFFHF
jgi:hypothetical protein